MRTLDIAVCDDDISTLELISSSIAAAFGKKGVATQMDTFFSAGSLLRRMETRKYDLLFLDIQMPMENGIELGSWLRERGDQVPIVYVSSREEKVFDALLTQPFGFVRKEKFLKEIVIVVDQFLERIAQRSEPEWSVVLQQKSGILRINARDIVYVEGSGKTQLLHLSSGGRDQSIYSTMEYITDQLQPLGFLRIHKGFLVNFRYIAAIESTDVALTSGEKLPLSRRTAQQVKEQYLSILKEQGALLL